MRITFSYTTRDRILLLVLWMSLHRVPQKQGSRYRLRSLHESRRDEFPKVDYSDIADKSLIHREPVNPHLHSDVSEFLQEKYIFQSVIFLNHQLSTDCLFELSENLQF